MILFCTGTSRTASTWTFNISLRLISAALPGCRIHAGYENDFARVLNHLEGGEQCLILESDTLDPLARKLVDLGGAKVIYTQRDPLDAIASYMSDASFTFEQALEAVSESAELYRFHLRTGNCFVVTYRSVVERPAESVRCICDYLGLSLPEQIRERITREVPFDIIISDTDEAGTVLTNEQQRIISAYPFWAPERDNSVGAVNQSLAQDSSGVAARQEPAIAALGDVHQLNDVSYRVFMDRLNEFAARHGMRVFRNWSKVWEYPWLWFHGLKDLPWGTMNLLDFGSELSPMPWFLATLGARVQLIEVDPQWVPQWTEWRRALNVNVDWQIVDSESLPVAEAWADAVTSFSVIEHQPGKAKAITEIVRVLKPNGVFAISFDICEPDMGMTFPAWNGAALTIHEFEELVWRNPAFGNSTCPIWNREDMLPFVQWHLQSAPHHNYAVGAAILRKAPARVSGMLTASEDDQRGCRNIIRTCDREDTGTRAKSVSGIVDPVFWFHYDDPGNLGDHVCCPLDYAGLPGVRVDLRQPFADLDGAAYIFGGGGLLHGGTIEQLRGLVYRGRSRNPKLRLIAWGIGANELGESTLTYPDFLREFDLVGIRDYGNPWEYVPCASCLHPVFDQPPGNAIHEFVVYEHYAVPITGLPPAPRMTNRGDRSRFSDVVEFLAQGECIITNSFHGAYWALLLGRKVMIFRPFANRFLGFSRTVEFCDETDWRMKMQRHTGYADYLAECQSINRRFIAKVGALLEDSFGGKFLERAVAARSAVSNAREMPARVSHLTSIRDALAAYHQARGRYPETSSWDGLYSSWGRSTPDWIPGLVPEYLEQLPRDPRGNDVPDQQYLYRSDGKDYKLISHSPEDYTFVRASRPELIDPVREGWAYGFWTEGAVGW